MNYEKFILDSSYSWMQKHTPVVKLFEHMGDDLSFVDIGAADGRICRAYQYLHPEAEILAVDVKWPAVIPDLDTLTVNNGQPIPLPDQSFDIVSCLFTLQHSENPWLLARECFRISRKLVIFGEGLIENRPYTTQEWLNLIGGQPFWTCASLVSVQGESIPGFIATYSPTPLNKSLSGAPQ